MIEWANATTYGLSANVLTDNSARAIRMANALEAGSIFVSPPFPLSYVMSSLTRSSQVNCALSVEACVPFGGYKQSGIGREWGEEALKT